MTTKYGTSADIGSRVVVSLAVLGLVLGSVQVFGNLAQAAAEEDWARFDRLLGWLWITVAVVVGITALVLLAVNLVMLPFWKLRREVRGRHPDLPVHLSYLATQPSGEVPLPEAIGPYSVVLVASPTGLRLWRGPNPHVVLDLPANRIKSVEFVRMRRPMMRLTLAEPEATILFALADEAALGVWGPSPKKVKQIVAEIAVALNRKSTI